MWSSFIGPLKVLIIKVCHCIVFFAIEVILVSNEADLRADFNDSSLCKITKLLNLFLHRIEREHTGKQYDWIQLILVEMQVLTVPRPFLFKQRV